MYIEMYTHVILYNKHAGEGGAEDQQGDDAVVNAVTLTLIYYSRTI